MKRNIHIQPLSRQHHNGLLAVLLLEKGLAKKADLTEMKAFIDHLFVNDLDEHFMLEEKYLAPLMHQYTALVEHANRIIDEHLILHQLRDGIVQAPSTENIAALAAMLEQHIRYEERHAFPATEKYFTEADFQKLGTALENCNDKNCMSYPVKFWE